MKNGQLVIRHMDTNCLRFSSGFADRQHCDAYRSAYVNVAYVQKTAPQGWRNHVKLHPHHVT
eukprot:429458-Amphidinium_carterae.2